MARGALRADGLVSVDAPYVAAADAATLLTRPLTFNGTLHLNVDAGGGGSVVVEVIGAPAATQPASVLATSAPVVSNSIRAPVKWLGAGWDPAWGAGPVQLRVRMQACSLYSLSFW